MHGDEELALATPGESHVSDGFLYVGSILNKESLLKEGITHILTVGDKTYPEHFTYKLDSTKADDFISEAFSAGP